MHEDPTDYRIMHRPAVCQLTGDDATQHISQARGRHGWIPGTADRQPLPVGNKRSGALEHDDITNPSYRSSNS